MGSEFEVTPLMRVVWAEQHAATLDALIQARPADVRGPGDSNVSIYRTAFLRHGEMISAQLVVQPGQPTMLQAQQRVSPHGPFASQQLTSPELAGIDAAVFLGLDEVDPDTVTWKKQATRSSIPVIRDPATISRLTNGR